MVVYPDNIPDVSPKAAAMALLRRLKKYYNPDTLSPIEEGRNFELLAAHYKVTEIAQELGVSRGYINLRRSFLHLISELQTALEEGRLMVKEAYALSKLDPEEQRKHIPGPEEE